MNSDTGTHLTSLRKAKGLSQEDLAEAIGVSRQAVSNWERAESLPDTQHLIRLSQLYGVTIDSLLAAETPAPEAAPQSPAVRTLLRTAGIAVGTAVACAAYYLFVAHPLLTSTVDDVVEMFGIPLSPALAVTWFIAEVVFVLVPFVALALVPARLPRWIWTAPLAVFLAPVFGMLLNVAFTGQFGEYGGLGGALMSSVMIKADVMALVGGCVLVDVAVRRRAMSTEGAVVPG